MKGTFESECDFFRRDSAAYFPTVTSLLIDTLV